MDGRGTFKVLQSRVLILTFLLSLNPYRMLFSLNILLNTVVWLLLLSCVLALGKEGKKPGFIVRGGVPGSFLCNCACYSNSQFTRLTLSFRLAWKFKVQQLTQDHISKSQSEDLIPSLYDSKE